MSETDNLRYNESPFQRVLTKFVVIYDLPDVIAYS